VPVIGFLGVTSMAMNASFVAAFRQGLKDRGYLEGQNIAIEFRIAGCCARAPSGHADAVLPSKVINSRRPMWIAMRPSRRGHTRAMKGQ
jgi:hypothetical protein